MPGEDERLQLLVLDRGRERMALADPVHRERSLSPRRTSSIPSTGASSRPNPLAARTPSAPTIAPASASKASVARSIASRIAAGSSSAVEIAATNSVSC